MTTDGQQEKLLALAQRGPDLFGD